MKKIYDIKGKDIEVIDWSVFRKYTDNILTLAYSAGGTDRNKCFVYHYAGYSNNTHDEALRLYFTHRYDSGTSDVVNVIVKINYNKTDKKIDYEVKPDLYSYSADAYVGTKTAEFTDLPAFFGGLGERLAGDLADCLTKFNAYRVYAKNRDTEVSIDWLEYGERLKASLGKYGLKVSMNPDEVEGYIIAVESVKAPEDDYITFNTAPGEMVDCSGVFEDYVELLHSDICYHARFKNTNALIKVIERIVDGTFRHLKMIEQEDKWISRYIVKDDDE